MGIYPLWERGMVVDGSSAVGRVWGIGDEKKPHRVGLLFSMLGGSGVSSSLSMKIETFSVAAHRVTHWAV
jgi:hypothetical protein